jgi:hypothetical protein
LMRPNLLTLTSSTTSMENTSSKQWKVKIGPLGVLFYLLFGINDYIIVYCNKEKI